MKPNAKKVKADTCANCRFFHPERLITPSPVGTVGHIAAWPTEPFNQGQCRVEGPKITSALPQQDGTHKVSGGWPPVPSFDWCGEWERKK